ncbi:unnamed protein product [Rotaria socialis]|uniref:CW-type domain-containing protein n=1 Tax=Rotaria socialis TaxID=392032 RepID=A0A817SN13_9BILA|nr:unnamed protein product [Rotaria socialis]
MKDQYDCLNKAQLSFEYLHTNSTTHTFLFGALAELVDNSKDADAKNLDIYTCKDPYLRGGFYLAFLDDGCGMHYDDVFNVIVFGKSAKLHSLVPNQIGQYGNGLKSGAMRISKDFILFTKKDNIGTCLFISRTFHHEQHISQIICPMPCFDLTTQQPVQNTDDDRINGTLTYTYDSSKHELEMQLIMKYSPFKTMNDLFKQFDLIKSSSGTLIVLYNLKLSDIGEPELDIKTDPYDILIDSRNRRNLLTDDDDSENSRGDYTSFCFSIPVEYRSLRAYVSILYYEPRMRITIQGRRVITKKLSYTLYKPRKYQFKSTRFKTRSEQEIKKCEKELLSLEERIREVDSQVHHLQHTSVTTSADERMRLRKLQINATELKDLANRLCNGLVKKRMEMNTTKTLTFIFGLNIQNRSTDGVFVYHCGRLIKMYEKVGQPNKKILYCRGVVGIIDIPSVVLETTHNKQSFADEKEYHFLLKNMGEYMRQYWTDTGIEHYVQEFWETYGYRDDQLDRPPSNDPEPVKRRQVAIPMLIQCDQCLKWRRLPFHGNVQPLTQSQLESWRCSDNSDILNNTCIDNEKLDLIPEGELKPKSQGTHHENRTRSRAVSPPARSSINNKRISNAEISSTTANINSKIATRLTVAPTSTAKLQNRILPSSRLLSAKAKTKKKRKRLIKTQSSKSKSTAIGAMSDDQDENESFAPAIQQTRHQTSTSIRPASTNEVYLIDDDDDDDDNTENIDDTNNRRPPPTIGAHLLAMYQGARRSGIVLSVNDKCGTFKMRFDEFPTAEFDYSFSYKSSAWSYIGTAPPSIDPTITSVETIPNEEEPLCSIAQKFKSLINFMLPPNWELTREQISSMSNDDLSQLDMTVFMHSYREKMTKIVEQHKADEVRWRTLAQHLQEEATKLLNLSGMSIPTDCSLEDFEEHIQRNMNQSGNIS